MFLSIHRLEYATSWFHTAFVVLMYWVEVESRMQVWRRVLYCNGSYWFVLARNQRRRLSSLCVMALLSMSTNHFSAVDRCRSWTKSMNQNLVMRRQQFDWILHKPNDGGQWKKATCLLRQAKLTETKTCKNLIKQKNEYSRNNSR